MRQAWGCGSVGAESGPGGSAGVQPYAVAILQYPTPPETHVKKREIVPAAGSLPPRHPLGVVNVFSTPLCFVPIAIITRIFTDA